MREQRTPGRIAEKMTYRVADLRHGEAVMLAEQEAFLLGRGFLFVLLLPEVAGSVGGVHTQIRAADTETPQEVRWPFGDRVSQKLDVMHCVILRGKDRPCDCF